MVARMLGHSLPYTCTSWTKKESVARLMAKSTEKQSCRALSKIQNRMTKAHKIGLKLFAKKALNLVSRIALILSATVTLKLAQLSVNKKVGFAEINAQLLILFFRRRLKQIYRSLMLRNYLKKTTKRYISTIFTTSGSVRLETPYRSQI